MYLRRGSGYYIEVGASELIADGRIKLKSGVEIERLTEDSVVLNDGTELKADLVVYATGYGSMNQWAAELISPEVADKVGKCWGLGSGTAKDPGPWEGELRKHVEADGAGEPVVPRRQPDAVAGSTRSSCRCSSRRSMEGLPTPVYARAAVHHKA
jgi:putative flavoprotein involved in K+ transport